jgi:MFS family permease
MFFLAWIDVFGVGHQKQSWLSIIMLSPFFSYFMGYIIASLLVTNYFEWQFVFIIQGVLLIPCVIFTVFTPLKYFDLDAAIELKKHQEEVQRQGTYMSSSDVKKHLMQDWNAYTSFGQPSVIIAGSLEARMREKFYQMDINLNEQQKLEQELLQSVKITQYDMARIVIKNRSFIFFTLSLTGYYFLISGLQLFFTDYA